MTIYGMRRKLLLFCITLGILLCVPSTHLRLQAADPAQKRVTWKSAVPKPGGVELSWNKSTSKIDGYQIRYTKKKDFSTYRIKTLAGKKTTTWRFKGLDSKTLYYFKIRSYRKVDGKRIYSAWSKIRGKTSGRSFEGYADLLGLKQSFRQEFSHGRKPAIYQKYIVIHDTEAVTSPMNIVDAWDSENNGVAAHFVIGRDGSVVQCVPLTKIAHHVGYGDAGNNKKYDVPDESRDDKKGTVPIGSAYPDYGMNSYSIGIELVHEGTSAPYPKAQLVALDRVIGYIDAFYGFDSEIIDHKMWRTTNSDTSPAFATYLKNYRKYRSYKVK